MSRRRHAKPEIEKALRFAGEHGWRIEVGGSHAWDGCIAPTTADLVEISAVTRQINLAKELNQLPKRAVSKRLQALVA